MEPSGYASHGFCQDSQLPSGPAPKVPACTGYLTVELQRPELLAGRPAPKVPTCTGYLAVELPPPDFLADRPRATARLPKPTLHCLPDG